MAVIRTASPLSYPDEWNTDGGLVFLTRSQLAVVRGLLAERPRWAASYEPRPPDGFADDYGSELLARLVYVAELKADDITNGTDGMSINVNVSCSGGGGNTGCCCRCENGGTDGYTRNIGQSQPVPSVYEPTDTSDWGTLDDYRLYKCRYANELTNDLLDTLSSWRALSLGLIGAGGAGLAALFSTGTAGGMIAGLIALGLTAEAAVLTLVGLFIALVAVGIGGFAWFEKLAITVDRDGLICRLYNAESDAAARLAIRDEFGSAANILVTDGDIPQAATSVLLEIVDFLVPDELLVALFEFVVDISDKISNDANVNCNNCSSVLIGTPNTGLRGVWYESDGVTRVTEIYSNRTYIIKPYDASGFGYYEAEIAFADGRNFKFTSFVPSVPLPMAGKSGASAMDVNQGQYKTQAGAGLTQSDIDYLLANTIYRVDVLSSAYFELAVTVSDSGV